MKLILPVLASASMFATPSLGAPCRDAQGKFIKYGSRAASAPTRCKDAKGRFTKCTAPGAKPA
jgi:hypothetical protein